MILYHIATSTSVGTGLYLHTPILLRTIYCNSVHGSRACQFAGRFWAPGGTKFTKMADSLPCTPMNHHAKFDAATFIFGNEIRIHTNTHTHKTQTNKQ